ncbi:Leucine-rich repeat-containing protein isoform 1 [Schistosoma japonicum]|uniref:Leucine-rich repeat-containing protein isoform 1 n=1 Tax=Schistosoma japonicum TaxID=6182 RepID=A0A4Z2CVX3_SCHJA|nr:Leucine-rich repeat-containing protein isoform 1 [Schistosoma japonicum]
MNSEFSQTRDKNKNREAENSSLIDDFISNAIAEASCSLDLKKCNLKEIPSRILKLPKLQKLYISDNCLNSITPSILTALSQLYWLDLRNNYLTCIPAEIKHLKELRTLLLDDNKIRILPPELGLLQNLSVLHHRNNPIEFPSNEVLSGGTKHVLKFLHNCYLGLVDIKNEKSLSTLGSCTDNTEEKFEIDYISAQTKQSGVDLVGSTNYEVANLVNFMESVNLEDSHTHHSSKIHSNSMDYNDLPESKTEKSYFANGLDSSVIQNDETIERSDEPNKTTKLQVIDHPKLINVLKSVINTDDSPIDNSKQEKRCSVYSQSSSKSKLYKKIAHNYSRSKLCTSKLNKASLLHKFPNQTSRHSAFLAEAPPQPTLEKIRLNYKREQKRKARKEIMIRQESQIQRMKNVNCISNWRDDYTQYQKKKLCEYLEKTYEEIKEESEKRISDAPFTVQNDQLTMIDRNELNSLRKRPLKKERPGNLDASTVLQLELASFERDVSLTRRVHEYTKEILERFKLPIVPTNDAIRSEMLVAKRSMDEAIRMHKRVQQRLETLGYFHGSNRRDLW